MTVKFAQSSKILSELGQSSLLGIVPGLADLLLQVGEVRLVTPQQPLFVEGEAITHCVIPLSDDLRLFRRGPDGAMQPFGLLQRRRALALGALLAGEPYPYSAVATSATTVLLVPRKAFVDHVGQFPLLAHYLSLMTSSPGVRGLRRYLSDEGLEHEHVMEVLEKIPLKVFTLEARQHYAPAEHRLVLVDGGQLLYSGVESSTRSRACWGRAPSSAARRWCRRRGCRSRCWRWGGWSSTPPS